MFLQNHISSALEGEPYDGKLSRTVLRAVSTDPYSLLATCLVIQILSGVMLAMHYNPSVAEAFNSVEHIMRDVNNGWLIRYLHSNTASAFFFIVYLHIGRGLYYGSYKAPRTLVWAIGTVIFILMMAKNKWPNWILVNIIYNRGTRCLSLLAFNRGRTRAILRVGPHSKEVLSIIICGMLALRKKYYSTNSKTGSDSGDNPNPNKKRLSNAEKKLYSVAQDLREIIIGHLLGDVCAQKRTSKGNTNLHFEQGFLHKDYILHSFQKFKDYCRSEPQTSERIADKRTNKIYTRIQFVTYSLPCFNEFYFMFYPNGKKIVPFNIGELLTPLGLAYWICDDGTFCKANKYIRIATNSYTLQEVDLLLGVLRTKFNLSCYTVREKTGYVITISSKSIPELRRILGPIMPSMMMHKLGLQNS